MGLRLCITTINKFFLETLQEEQEEQGGVTAAGQIWASFTSEELGAKTPSVTGYLFLQANKRNQNV